MKLLKLRAYLLEKGDEFMMLGRAYKVFCVNEKEILFTIFYPNNCNARSEVHSFGVNSRQRIMLIIKPHKNDRQKATYSTFSGVDHSGSIQTTVRTESTSPETIERKHQPASEGNAVRCRCCQPIITILNRAGLRIPGKL